MSNGTTELDRPVPLYMQVVRQLRAQIAAGDLRDGDTAAVPAGDDGPLAHLHADRLQGHRRA